MSETSSESRLLYTGSRAWHPLIGCDPAISCSPRCWARRTVARVVECQRKDHTERAEFFASVLTPNLKRWNGKVLLDEAHLTDPLRRKTPTLYATGFHGDIALLADEDKDQMFAVMALCPQHRFLCLTKRPERAQEYLGSPAYRQEMIGIVAEYRSGLDRHFDGPGTTPGYGVTWRLPFANVHLGASIMNQADADAHRPAMQQLAAMGWATHVWYEPAIGPIDWRGWETTKLIICGGESGPDARPMHPDWARNTRDWCAENGVAFKFKQWGGWAPHPNPPQRGVNTGAGLFVLSSNGQSGCQGDYWDGKAAAMDRVGKKAAGCLLDGVLHKELPKGMRP